MTANPILAATGLVLARQGRVFARLPDLTIAGGETFAVVGASGTGKTTALMALAGIRPPYSGTIIVEDIDLWALPMAQRDRLRGRRIGLVFQSFHLVQSLDVRQNLILAARCAGLRFDPDRVTQLLQRLDLTAIAGHRCDRISHGQAQRVAVARALFNRPAIILADEPTSALDDANAANLLGLMKEAAGTDGAALLLATHDHRILGAVDRVIEMEVAA